MSWTPGSLERSKKPDAIRCDLNVRYLPSNAFLKHRDSCYHMKNLAERVLIHAVLLSRKLHPCMSGPKGWNAQKAWNLRRVPRTQAPGAIVQIGTDSKQSFFTGPAQYCKPAPGLPELIGWSGKYHWHWTNDECQRSMKNAKSGHKNLSWMVQPELGQTSRFKPTRSYVDGPD